MHYEFNKATRKKLKYTKKTINALFPIKENCSGVSRFQAEVFSIL